MLTIFGNKTSCCDDIPRRCFLKAGFLGMAGLSLPQMLRIRAEAAATGGAPAKTSVIFIELQGGPSQFETYDPKPDAPAEYRGAFGVVPTKLPGVVFSELMPQQARVIDKLAIVRSVHHENNNHYPSRHLTQTGHLGDHSQENLQPSAGSITARLRGANVRGVPPYVHVLEPSFGPLGRAAYLGGSYDPFAVGNPNREDFKVKNLALAEGLTMNRLEDRQSLHGILDAARRVVDKQGVSQAMDHFTHEALDMLTSERARTAFEIDREPDEVRDRYGRNTHGQSLLLARRLVEAGVTFVTVCLSGWDDHNKIKERISNRGPKYDQAAAALVTDLYQRGLDRDVLVVSMGEFGRTPRINQRAGRDHWGALMSVMLSGGGLRVGQVIGTSSSKGEEPTESPYRPENVLAMLYRHLGIDTTTTFNDFTGRPQHILGRRGLIKELI